MIERYTLDDYRKEMASTKKKLDRDWQKRIIERFYKDKPPENIRYELNNALRGMSFVSGIKKGYINQIRWALADQSGQEPVYLSKQLMTI